MNLAGDELRSIWIWKRITPDTWGTLNSSAASGPNQPFPLAENHHFRSFNL